MDLFSDHMVVLGGSIEWYWVLAIVVGGMSLVGGIIACACTNTYFGRATKKETEEATHVVAERTKKMETKRPKKKRKGKDANDKMMKKKRKRTQSSSSRGPLPPLDLQERRASANISANIASGPDKFYGAYAAPSGSMEDNTFYGETDASVVPPSKPKYIKRSGTEPGGKTLVGYYNKSPSGASTPSSVMTLNFHGNRKLSHPSTPSTSRTVSSNHSNNLQTTALINTEIPERSLTPTDNKRPARVHIESEIDSDSNSNIMELRTSPTQRLGAIYQPKTKVLVDTSAINESDSSGIGSSLMTLDTQTNMIATRDGAIVEESNYHALNRKLVKEGLIEMEAEQGSSIVIGGNNHGFSMADTV